METAHESEWGLREGSGWEGKGSESVTKKENKLETLPVVYEEYIHSPGWRRKRADYFSSGRPRHCQGCMDRDIKSVHLHHKTYERLGHEDLDDLVAVCQNCHQMIHDRYDLGDGISLWDATELVLEKLRAIRPQRSKPVAILKQTPKKRSASSLDRLRRQGETGRRRTSKTDTLWDARNAEYVRLRDMENAKRGW